MIIDSNFVRNKQKNPKSIEIICVIYYNGCMGKPTERVGRGVGGDGGSSVCEEIIGGWPNHFAKHPSVKGEHTSRFQGLFEFRPAKQRFAERVS